MLAMVDVVQWKSIKHFKRWRQDEKFFPYFDLIKMKIALIIFCIQTEHKVIQISKQSIFNILDSFWQQQL